ncbi:PucR family transcriptional regulator [Desulfosporosinus metallidurans]|uniref:Regulator of polyketide synthase expression n=1 Tax=Desulfosporosinus metallidurans TaxID=1888891 RepID=A0A1Q8QP89_9FIRM|nr:PucR family transcriptional regulator [Desulfosporosinus metallidurans]OLN29147.1 Regulator of polyketide synthase expression [Desulfosporosinus metallidurans]
MIGILAEEVFELLSPVGVEIRAGKKGLSNVVETVSVLEVGQYDEWMHEGVLILTTLSHFNSMEKIYKLIRDLGRVKNCLGVHPGNKAEIALDRVAYELADELGVPIFVLPKDLPYDGIISTVLETILNRQKVKLEKSQQINKYLTEILLTGGSFERISLLLKSILKHGILIFDSDFNTIGFPDIKDFPKKGFIERVSNVLRDQTINYQEKNRICQRRFPEIETFNFMYKDQCYWIVAASIFINEEFCGCVVEIRDTEQNDRELEIAEIALTHGVTACALEILKRKAVDEAEHKLNFDFFDDLLNEHYPNEKAILQRAKNLGIDLQGKHIVMVVDINGFSDYRLKNAQKGEGHFLEVKNRMLKTVKTILMASCNKSTVIPKSDCFILLLNLITGIKDKKHKNFLLQIAEEIKASINKSFGQLTVSVGIGSDFSSVINLSKSFHQAQLALEIGRKIRGYDNIFDFQELGIYSFLSQFGKEQLRETCLFKLERLLEYDRTNKGDLLKTMESYLDCNANINKTASKMYIHPNTVKYRLNRIKEVLGEDPFENGEQKLSYHFSLKAFKVL